MLHDLQGGAHGARVREMLAGSSPSVRCALRAAALVLIGGLRFLLRPRFDETLIPPAVADKSNGAPGWVAGGSRGVGGSRASRGLVASRSQVGSWAGRGVGHACVADGSRPARGPSRQCSKDRRAERRVGATAAIPAHSQGIHNMNHESASDPVQVPKSSHDVAVHSWRNIYHIARGYANNLRSRRTSEWGGERSYTFLGCMAEAGFHGADSYC